MGKYCYDKGYMPASVPIKVKALLRAFKKSLSSNLKGGGGIREVESTYEWRQTIVLSLKS